MPLPTFAIFYEQIMNTAAVTNGPGHSHSSNIRDNRIVDPQGNRTGTKNRPGATNTVSQVNINTQTPTKNKIDGVAASPQKQEVLDDMDVQEIQNTHGIDLSTLQDNQPKQINSRINAAVVRSVGPNGQPIFTLMHYKPTQ